jgi:hypothetical protein
VHLPRPYDFLGVVVSAVVHRPSVAAVVEEEDNSPVVVVGHSTPVEVLAVVVDTTLGGVEVCTEVTKKFKGFCTKRKSNERGEVVTRRKL